MPSAIELLETRRTIPAVNLKAPAPSGAELDRLLTVASRVPDHGKLAPWRFILYRGEARRTAGERLAELRAERDPEIAPEKLAEDRGRFTRAPLVVGVVSRAAPHFKIPEWEQELSAGAACMNLLNAAHALGYAAQWLTDWCAYDEAAIELLGGRPGERFAGFIHIGTPDVPPAERPRPALADIVSEWQG